MHVKQILQIAIQNVTTSEDYVNTEISATSTNVDYVNVYSLPIATSDTSPTRLDCYADDDKGWIVTLP